MATDQGILNLYGGEMWPQIKQWVYFLSKLTLFPLV